MPDYRFSDPIEIWLSDGNEPVRKLTEPIATRNEWEARMHQLLKKYSIKRLDMIYSESGRMASWV